MKTINILLTDNNGSYYGKYIIKTCLVDRFVLRKIREVVTYYWENYEVFLEDFSWNIIKVAKYLEQDLEKWDVGASVKFEYNNSDYTLNVNDIFREEERGC